MAPVDHMRASSMYVDQSTLAPDMRIHAMQGVPMQGVQEMHPMSWHQNIDGVRENHESFGRHGVRENHAGQLATAGELEAGELQATRVVQDVLVPTIGMRPPARVDR